MRVLLIGSGGREHALALALAEDLAVTELVVAPGNPGIAAVASVRELKPTDPDAVAGLAVEMGADLVIIGPEAPLVAGVADAVRARGIACFGPSAEAARLEGSKSFAKEIMVAAGVPTARAHTCTDEAAVVAALDEFGSPYVVKADGLAAGKGVVVTEDRAVALAHARDCGRVVIEEFLDGPEISLFVVTDGVAAVALLPAQDFKRRDDGDSGPNTGGMGAYAPVRWLPPDFTETVMAQVVHPTLAVMRQRGTPFSGLLYVGLAVTRSGPAVVEFNARFGDPETQVVLPLLETPFAGLLHAAATGTLADHPVPRWRDGAAVVVVMASAGYPDRPQTGEVAGEVAVGAIGGVAGGVHQPGVIHASTAYDKRGALVPAGGRVLGCVGVGSDLDSARQSAYQVVEGISFAGAQYRTDIALAAVQGRIPGLG